MMSKRTLDRSRTFGERYPPDKVAFFQDGYYFDSAGNEVVIPGVVAPGAKASEPDAPDAPDAPVADEAIYEDWKMGRLRQEMQTRGLKIPKHANKATIAEILTDHDNT